MSRPFDKIVKVYELELDNRPVRAFLFENVEYDGYGFSPVDLAVWCVAPVGRVERVGAYELKKRDSRVRENAEALGYAVE